MNETTMTGSIRASAHPREAAVERYLRFWNATDPGERDRIAADTFADGVRYHAPVGVLVGAGALAEFADEFRRRVGAADVVPVQPPEHHHDRARLRWELRVDEAVFASGTDILVLDDTGRVREVTTFLDRAPEGFEPHAH